MAARMPGAWAGAAHHPSVGRNAGDRKRFAFTDEDKEKVNLWVLTPLDQVSILIC